MSFRPTAVLLDVGGVFHMPLRSKISEAMARIGHDVTDPETIDRAHFVAVGSLPMERKADADSAPFWERYLVSYAASLGVGEDNLDAAVEGLGAEFATVALWAEIVAGSKEGLRALLGAGIRVGIVSNSDGSVAERLRSQDVLQVGPGPGIAVECVVDSGQVGVSKPDPRIFRIALEALGVSAEETWYVGDTPAIDVVGALRAGIHPILMDPFGLRGDLEVSRVASLHDVADLVDRI